MDTTSENRGLSTGESLQDEKARRSQWPYSSYCLPGVPWAQTASSHRTTGRPECPNDPDDPSDYDIVLNLIGDDSEMAIPAIEAIDWAVAAMLHHQPNGWHVLKRATQAIQDAIANSGVRVQAPRKEPIPPMLRRVVLERDAYRCQECDSWLDLAVDHVIPESKGGLTVIENLQTLCRPCNSRKGASL